MQPLRRFGMDAATPEGGVQVQFHDYGEDDINVADLWIKVQFSELPPHEQARFDIRDAVFRAIVDAFHGLRAHGVELPKNFILDVFWGPTNGCGSVNGTHIEW